MFSKDDVKDIALIAAIVLLMGGAAVAFHKPTPTQCEEFQRTAIAMQVCARGQASDGIPVCTVTPSEIERLMRLDDQCKKERKEK